MFFRKESRLLVTDTGQEFQGMSEIILGEMFFYVKLPEKFNGSLELLNTGAETAEQAYQLNLLLKILKSRTMVLADDGDGGEVTDFAAARAQFFKALKEKEDLHAWNLRERLRGDRDGADW